MIKQKTSRLIALLAGMKIYFVHKAAVVLYFKRKRYITELKNAH